MHLPLLLAFYSIFFLAMPLHLFSQDSKLLSKKSAAMYKMKGKVFYGRPLKNIPIQQQQNDSGFSEIMRIKKQDIFRNVEEHPLGTITDAGLSVMESQDASMRVKTTDVLGLMENLNPISKQKILLLDENESLMKISSTDVFGNFAFENLNPDKSYKIRLMVEGELTLPENNMIYIANDQDEILRSIKVEKGKSFYFQTLAPVPVEIKLLEPQEAEIKMKPE